jgi:hypothetical protein
MQKQASEMRMLMKEREVKEKMALELHSITRDHLNMKKALERVKEEHEKSLEDFAGQQVCYRLYGIEERFSHFGSLIDVVVLLWMLSCVCCTGIDGWTH